MYKVTDLSKRDIVNIADGSKFRYSNRFAF